jgi:deoxyribonuclease V
MKVRQIHPWDVTPKEAVRIQKTLISQMTLKRAGNEVKLVAGTDVACSRKSDAAWAGVVVFTFPGLEPIERQWHRTVTRFPYVPGLLSFREIPVLAGALEKLVHEPDLVFCDGQGLAHPRNLGLASHLGLLLQKPAIGCAKKRLVGEFSEVGKNRGNWRYLRYGGRTVGAVLRTRRNVKPVFVSPGYGITVEEAVNLTLKCGRGYRIPEPTRLAHIMVTSLRQREDL